MITMHTKRLFIFLLVPLLHTTTADAKVIEFAPPDGQSPLAPFTPPWCAKVDASQGGTAGQLERRLESIKSGGWYFESLVEVAQLVCLDPKAPELQAQTAQIVQGWMALTGVTREQAIAGITARLDVAGWERKEQEACAAIATSSEAIGRQRELGVVVERALGCGSRTQPFWFDESNGPDEHLIWYLDDSVEAPSQIAVAYHVLNCLPKPRTTDVDDSDLGRYASCGVDARRLDEKRLERELAASGWNDYATITAREHHAHACRVARVWEANARAAAAKDPAYQQILFDAPEAGWAAWVAEIEANRAAWSAAIDYGTRFMASEPKPVTGCHDTLRANVDAWIAAKHPKTMEEAKAALTRGMGYVLATHLAACLAAEGRAYGFRQLDKLVSKGLPARGPRHAAHYAALDALVAIRTDRPRFSMEPGNLPRRGGSKMLGLAAKMVGSKFNMTYDEWKGVVKTAKKKGDWVEIVFKPDRYVDTVWSCKDTNRISGIDGNGRFYYEQNCHSVGEKVVDRAPEPVLVPVEDTAAIKPGVFVIVNPDSPKFGEPQRGAVLEVWADKKRERLIGYLGFKL
jgi:hypothetical protein